MNMYKEFKPLQEYISRVCQKLEVTDAVDSVQAIAAYRSVVGDLIDKLSTNLRYDNRRLFVTIVSAALRTELSYKRQSLVQKINEKVGREVLADIVFV